MQGNDDADGHGDDLPALDLGRFGVSDRMSSWKFEKHEEDLIKRMETKMKASIIYANTDASTKLAEKKSAKVANYIGRKKDKWE